MYPESWGYLCGTAAHISHDPVPAKMVFNTGFCKQCLNIFDSAIPVLTIFLKYHAENNCTYRETSKYKY